MATTKTQRIGIWLIAVLMAVGTIGSFVVVGMANDNARRDQERYNALYSQYQADTDAYKEKLSEEYFAKLNEQKKRVASFKKEDVTNLAKTDLVKGDGEELTAESSFYAYYIGWNASGKIFDSSFNETNDGLKDPFQVFPGGVIEGWTEGLIGVKEGGIRELTIPADLAYGDQDRGEDIPANSPLKFIILIVPEEKITNSPEPSQELLDLSRRI